MRLEASEESEELALTTTAAKIAGVTVAAVTAAAVAAESAAAEAEAAAAAAEETASVAEGEAAVAALEGLVRRGLNGTDFDLSVRLLFEARLRAEGGVGESLLCIDRNSGEAEKESLAASLISIQKAFAACAVKRPSPAKPAEQRQCGFLRGHKLSSVQEDGETVQVSAIRNNNAEAVLGNVRQGRGELRDTVSIAELRVSVQEAAAALAARLSSVEPSAPSWTESCAALASADRALRQCGRNDSAFTSDYGCMAKVSSSRCHSGENGDSGGSRPGCVDLDGLISRLHRRCHSMEEFDCLVLSLSDLSISLIVFPSTLKRVISAISHNFGSPFFKPLLGRCATSNNSQQVRKQWLRSRAAADYVQECKVRSSASQG